MIKALDEGQLSEGKYVREFESKFAEYVHARHCLLVPNGSVALLMAVRTWLRDINTWLSSARIKVSDYYSIFAANAVRMLGRHVEIIDLGSDFKTESTAFTIPVHVNGRLSKATLIEDSCQSVSHHTSGALSCYSFHPSKLLTCAGIGGAVCCDDEESYHKLAALKDHGRPERVQRKPITDRHLFIGSNFKVNDVSAAFGLEQLKRLPARLDRFREIYKIYQELLGDKVGWIEGEPSWRVDCLVDEPDEIIVNLAKNGIEAKRFYRPLHMQPQFSQYVKEESYPNTMRLYQHGIYLPSNLTITDEDVQRVCDCIKKER